MPDGKKISLKPAIQIVSKFAKQILDKIEKYRNRQAAANFMMISFILLVAIGCFQIYAPAGFISAGISCGVFGFLLGQE